MYARPCQQRSRPLDRAWGMAHILGRFQGSARSREEAWDKTWAYLKELGQYVEYYPTGTAITLKEFAQGQRWIIAGIMEWDMKPRAQSVIPPDSKISYSREHHLCGRRALLVHSRSAMPKDRRSTSSSTL